jgi:hypothetical protein
VDERGRRSTRRSFRFFRGAQLDAAITPFVRRSIANALSMFGRFEPLSHVAHVL